MAQTRTFFRILLLALLAGVPSFTAAVGPDRNLHSVLQQTVEDLRISEGKPWGVIVSGLAAAAITDANGAKQVVAVASGAADPPGDIPLKTGDRFHIGSITKSFTAALIMQLNQEGKLSLNEPIEKWIQYPNGSNITIKMLLGHTSGVPNHTDNPGHKPTNTPLQSIALSAQQKPVFAPGTSWSYSNTNYIILGVIAEKATASTWQKQLESRFFEPLALSDTYVWNGKAVAKTVTGSRLNCGYPGEPDCVEQPGFKIIPETAGADWTVAWSAGAIVSTPTDVARWMRALVSGNVLDAEHRALLTTPTRESVKVLANKPPYGTLRWTGGSLGLLRFEIEGVGVGWGTRVPSMGSSPT
jgi:D-alanyl-D-alanine carboxypeptidase